jgi:zinc protease
VRQEHDWRVGSKPIVRFARKLDRLLLPDHPSGQAVIGTREDIDAFRLDDARAFHRAWYAINNVDFVVMADIEPAVLKDIADRALAGLESRPLPPRTFAKPPLIVEGRTDVVEQDATIQRPVVFFKKLVRIEEDDTYAMGAVRLLVMNFLTSRLRGSLYDVLVDRGRLAAGAPSVSLARIASKTFALTIAAEAAQDVAPETVLAAITAYVEQLEPASLSAATLARLQTRFAEGRAAADKDPRQVYNRLVGWLAGRSRYEQLGSWPQRMAAVSTEQAAVVLEALAGPGRIVTGTLAPVDGRP